MNAAKPYALAALCLGILGVIRQPVSGGPAPRAQIRFEAIDVTVDAGARPLAAYQFELSDPEGRIAIVGVEGGDHEAFAEPPYYDPRALMNDRIIIAAFTTGADLPVGATRVATIHVQVTGASDPDYDIRLVVAASPEGVEIPASASISKGE